MYKVKIKNIFKVSFIFIFMLVVGVLSSSVKAYQLEYKAILHTLNLGNGVKKEGVIVVTMGNSWQGKPADLEYKKWYPAGNASADTRGRKLFYLQINISQ